MSRFGWAFVNDIITGSATVSGLENSVVVRAGSMGIVSGATNFIFNNSTGFGQLTGSLAITNDLNSTTITGSTSISGSQGQFNQLTASNLWVTNNLNSRRGEIDQLTASSAIILTLTASTSISGSQGQFAQLTASSATIQALTLTQLTASISGSQGQFAQLTASSATIQALTLTQLTASISGSQGQFAQLTASSATIQALTASNGISGSQGQFAQLTASTGIACFQISGDQAQLTQLTASSAIIGTLTGSTSISGSQGRFLQLTASSATIQTIQTLTGSSLTVASHLSVSGTSIFQGAVSLSDRTAFNGGVYVNTRIIDGPSKYLEAGNYFIILSGSTPLEFDIGVPSVADTGRTVIFRNVGGAQMDISASLAVIFADLGGSASTTTYRLGGDSGNVGAIFITDGTYWYRIANS